jgi:hypothetical protein
MTAVLQRRQCTSLLLFIAACLACVAHAGRCRCLLQLCRRRVARRLACTMRVPVSRTKPTLLLRCATTRRHPLPQVGARTFRASCWQKKKATCTHREPQSRCIGSWQVRARAAACACALGWVLRAIAPTANHCCVVPGTYLDFESTAGGFADDPGALCANAGGHATACAVRRPHTEDKRKVATGTWDSSSRRRRRQKQ